MFLLATAAVILCAILLVSVFNTIRALIYVGSGKQALDDRLRIASKPTR
jgi:hypothetical protein